MTSSTLFIEAFFLGSLLTLTSVAESSPRSTALGWLEANERYLVEAAETLWALPEPAHQEVQTAQYLQRELRDAGFTIQTEVAGLPTAFVASYGSGRSIIGIVALLDALPGLSQQQNATERLPIEPGGAGHGCGHNLIAAADLGAALAVKHAIDSEEIQGTVRLIGAPAEEIYHGGVYMTRDGVFDDLDALLFWHPSAVTTVIGRSGLAMDSVRFVFRGLASDATDAAAKGVNALTAAYRLADAVSRETWPADSVVNHVLLEGGTIPSIVPELATQWFFIHGRDRDAVDALRRRVEAIAHATAESSRTELDVQLLSSTREWLINRELGRLIDRHLRTEPPVAYTNDDIALARALQRDFAPASEEAFVTPVLPLSFADEPVLISDDTAEASWVTPRGGFLVACFPAGVPSHTWQWTSSASSSFAHRCMLRAARVVTSSAIELLTNEETLRSVRREFEDATEGGSYVSPLPSGRGAFDFLKRE